jgi:Synergist-CTERM protein sorting domain-containing protein
VWSAGAIPARQPKGSALPFSIKLRDADTVLVIRPNSHLDYYQDALDLDQLSAVATTVTGTNTFVTTGPAANNALRSIAASDANWTAARFNGGLLALESDPTAGGYKTHTQAGFVQNVRVDVRQGTLRIVATTAGPANPSAFGDNVFKSLNIAAGATFRLDDESEPNANNASIAAAFRHLAGTAGWGERRSVWARVDALTGTGTIDLGATTPEVVLTSSPATLRTTGQNYGNAIDFNFNGTVDNFITGQGGIRITGGKRVKLTNSANNFEGPILVNGTLEVGSDDVTGNLNYVYVASGGAIKAVDVIKDAYAHEIKSSLIFDKNSVIYTDVTDGQNHYLKVGGGISLAATVVPGDMIKLTAPAVNAKAGTNIVVLEGIGVQTLVQRIVVTDNNGVPVLDKWNVQATANNELVLHALKDVNDSDNPNKPVEPVDPVDPVTPPLTITYPVPAPASVKTGTAVTFQGKIDPAVYDLTTLKVKPEDKWDVKVIDSAAGLFEVTSKAPLTATTSYSIEAKNKASGEVETATGSITVTNPDTPTTGGGGGGCDAGFAGLALLLAAPLFLRKRG